MQAPNGWISHDLIIWNELDSRGFATKGFTLEVPDLRHASEHALDAFYSSVRHFLHTLDESTRAQIRWSVDSDYREELTAYKSVTDEKCDPNSWAAISRNERFNRYWRAMQSGHLRREKLVLFLSRPITTNPPPGANSEILAEHYERTLGQYQEMFEQHGRVLSSLFEPHGCRTTSINTADLFRLVLPAGTEVHGIAQKTAASERVGSERKWMLVFQDGRELPLSGTVLDYAPDGAKSDAWDETDGSAGLRGYLVASDKYAEAKAILAR